MARQFVLPLRSISTPIQLNNLVAGRWDLVCRCMCNAMLISDGVRNDTKLQLILSNDNGASTGNGVHSNEHGDVGDGSSSQNNRGSVFVEIDGSKAENLRPDERHLASLLQWLLDPPTPSAWKVQEYRRHRPGVSEAEARDALVAVSRKCLGGFEARRGVGLCEALDRTLCRPHQADSGCEVDVGGADVSMCPGTAGMDRASASLKAPTPPLVLLLDAAGEHFAAVCTEPGAQQAARQGGVVIVLGGSKGLLQGDVVAVEAWAEAAGVCVRRVSLGRTTLLASQCITIVHHYLDALLAHEA